MPDLVTYLDFDVILDYTQDKVAITDTSNYPAGVAPGITGIVAFTQPDGITEEGDWSNPDVWWVGGFTYGFKPLRRDVNGGPQNGTYSVTYTIDHPDYLPSSKTKIFELNYTPVTQNTEKVLDLFTPYAAVTDKTNYTANGFVLASGYPQWFWDVQIGNIGSKTANGPTVDLIYNGNYYATEYTVNLYVLPNYVHTTYTWLLVADIIRLPEMKFQLYTPPTIVELQDILKTIKDRTNDGSCDNHDAMQNYIYAYTLFSNILDLLATGNTGPIYDYIQEIMNIYLNSLYVFISGGLPIPPYNYTPPPSVADNAEDPYEFIVPADDWTEWETGKLNMILTHIDLDGIGRKKVQLTNEAEGVSGDMFGYHPPTGKLKYGAYMRQGAWIRAKFKYL